MQLRLLLRPAKVLPALPVRVALKDLSVRGRCCVGLTMAPDQAPGITSAAVSFAQPPAVDFELQPFGLPFGDLPYVLDLLKVSTLPLFTLLMICLSFCNTM